MVAARIHTSPSPAARNVVRRPARTPDDVRGRPRCRVALPAWLCGEDGSARGYALDVSRSGARFGGMGLRFSVGDRVLAKIVVDRGEAPLVLRAEVVRYAPTPGACPELCVRFLEGPGTADVEEHCRLASFVASLG